MKNSNIEVTTPSISSRFTEKMMRKRTMILFTLLFISLLMYLYIINIKMYSRTVSYHLKHINDLNHIHNTPAPGELSPTTIPTNPKTVEPRFAQLIYEKFKNKRYNSSGGRNYSQSAIKKKICQEYLNSTNSEWSVDYLEILKSQKDINLWRPPMGNLSNGIYSVDIFEDGRVAEQNLLIRYNFTGRNDTEVKVIYLKDGLQWWTTNEQTHQDDFLKCPGSGLGQCSIIWDTKKNHNFNYSDVHAQVQVIDGFHPQDSTQAPENVYNLFVILESPYHSYANLERDRDLLSSYWRGSDILTPYFSWIYYDRNVISSKQSKNYADGKSKLAAIFVSNCGDRNGRLQYVQKLQEYMEVDVYGRCGKLKCGRDQDDKCVDMLRNDYFFYLAFENSNCRDYITEKLLKALKNDVVPVVLGAHPDDYKIIAPQNSYIQAEDFSSPQELAAYLTFISKDPGKYNEYFEWKGTGQFVQEKYFCKVCNMLHYADIVEPPKRTDSLNWFARNFCLEKNHWYWNRNNTL